MKHSRPLFLLCAVLILASLACSLPVTQPQTPAGFNETSIALGVQQTSLAIEKATLQARTEATPAPLPSATPLPPTQPPAAPTATPQPVQAAVTQEPTAEPSATAVDIEARIRGANVLVFEDMRGNFDRKPLVQQAVSEMDFSGGRVMEVGDALGKFKEQLINSTHWDLIVVAAEYRSAVQGEFWQYVYDQVNRGVAVVIEIWYMDQHYTDIQPLLSQCGLEFQQDWTRGPNYRLEDYAIYWLQPEHAYFQDPQQAVSLGNPNYLYWVPPVTNDAGDLLQLGSNGDAVLLAGTYPNLKSQYGVLGACMDGRMIVQTFSSHDYKPIEVVNLWKNSMRYTLTNHFLGQ